MSVNGHVFGTRIRHLREAMDLSLRDLAERSGVSAPMLSPGRARRDQPDARRSPSGSPTGLELTPVAAAAPRRERRRERRPRATSAAGGGASRGHRYEVLTPPLPGQRAEVSLHTLAPGAATGGPDDPPMHEPGSRETAVVIDGRAAPRLRRRARTTSTSGDAVTFDADLPHHFENPGPADARFLRGRRRRTTQELTMPQDAVRQDLGRPRGRRRACSTSTCTSCTRSRRRRRSSRCGWPGARCAGPTARSPPPTTTCPPTARRPRPQIRDPLSRVQVETLERNCAEFGVPIYSIGSARQGIVHVIGPELGVTQPGHDDRLRRLAHLHPRRLRRAGVRHRHQRGRARARHPDAPAAQAAARCASPTRASCGYGVTRQGPDPRHDRPDRRRRRRRAT